jgi:hypothetical protein
VPKRKEGLLSEIERIKELALISMFSDDDLMEALVLKGGNALDLAYNLKDRASIDLDFSIENTFEDNRFNYLRGKLKTALETTFHESGYVIFDFKIKDVPPNVSKDLKKFWGGYKIEFKIIKQEKYKKLKTDINELRKHASEIAPNHKKSFSIQISKFEYCDGKKEIDFGGYSVFVYSPSMIVVEKLRAICQQMPEYSVLVKSRSRSARARDFYDIYRTMKAYNIDLTSKKNIELMTKIFEKKCVPTYLLGDIKNFKEYHRPDFQTVIDTIRNRKDLKIYDYYFDFVVNEVEKLKSFWEK